MSVDYVGMFGHFHEIKTKQAALDEVEPPCCVPSPYTDRSSFIMSPVQTEILYL